MSINYPTLESVDVGAVMVRFGADIQLETNQQVHAFAQWLSAQAPIDLRQHLLELVPSYNCLLIYYNFLKVADTDFQQDLQACLQAAMAHLKTHQTKAQASQCHEIGVIYTSEYGLDLERIAAHAGCSIAEVIDLHTSVTYHVYAIGFAPNFAYLGDVPQALRLPRLDSPRQKVPAGTLAIAEQQTAIYPRTSPGGWNLLGYCPEIPTFNAGDSVRFYALENAAKGL